MNSYKDLNHALTIQNQEMRQQIARFKHEIVDLNRKLMAERQLAQTFKRRYCRFVADILKSCNDAVRESNQSFEDLMADSIEESQSEILQDKNNSNRSVRLVQPLRETLMQINECDKENVSPLEEVVEDSSVSYVQTRRRRHDESSLETSSEISQPLLVETSEHTASLNRLQDAEDIHEDIAGSNQRKIDTIREECTEDLSQLSVSATQTSQATSYAIIINDSSICDTGAPPSTTAVPDTRQNKCIASVSVQSHEQSSQSITLTETRTERMAIAENTLFNNFLASSTPYKVPITHPKHRKCYVRVKRLTPIELLKAEVEIGNSTTDDTISETPLNNIRKRKNFSRPRRNAAPKVLKEPSILTKLRRN